MKTRTKLSLVGLGLLGSGIGAALVAGAAGWNAETARLVVELEQDATTGAAQRVSFALLNGLPEPVARYFRYALRDGQTFVRTARIGHAGEFNLDGKWIPFQSEQNFSAHPPGFVWDASMRMNPIVTVRVRDAYRKGRASMTAKVFGLVTMVDAGREDEKLAAGALMRYLAESPWHPTALLPREGLAWSPVDDDRARATLSDSGISVSLEFTFGPEGEITGIFSPERYKEGGGEYRQYPWAGRFWNYERHAGMMIPMEGEVEWRMPGGPEPYWRGRVVDVTYEFAAGNESGSGES